MRRMCGADAEHVAAVLFGEKSSHSGPSPGRATSTLGTPTQSCSTMPNQAMPRYRTDEGACSCKDWWYRRPLDGCKHMRKLRDALAWVRAQQEFNEAVDAARQEAS